MRTHQDPWVLSLKGVVCGCITFASDAFSNDTLRKRQNLAPVVLRCLDHIKGLGMNQVASPDYDSVILTLMCGIDGQNRKAVSTDDLRSKYHEFIAWCQRAEEEGLANEEDNSSYPDYWYSISNSSTNRRFVVSDSELLGMAPLQTRPGDYLCVISGSAVPFVLRKLAGRWKLIGDAYCRKAVMVIGPDLMFDQAGYERQSEWLDIC
ncbi:hypothetical protein F5B17DRAFT_159209 [Nemania serpens]|nr:hypothetical protein F5B17DRAFT_159209 [Nemania serpens]